VRDFTIIDRTALIELLQARQGMTEDQADVFTFALSDIRWSAIEIYDDYLGEAATHMRTSTGDIQDTISDIREACPPY
jgi:hypothetical protein